MSGLVGKTREVMQESRRGVILRTLHDQPDFALNDGVLQDALGNMGHGVARDVVKTDLAWLEEQGLVSTKPIATLVVATLTQRGEDVACGRAQVPGVKRPDPRG